MVMWVLIQFIVDHYLWTSLLAMLTTVYIYKSVKRSRLRLPPGPTGLPFLGYFPFMDKDLHLQLTKMHKTYGDVFSIQLGSRYAVVINSFQAMKEANNKDDFSGRPPGFYKVPSDTNHIGLMGSKDWKATRKFTLSSLRTLGMGKNKVEEMIMMQVSTLLDSLTQTAGKTEVDVRDQLSGVITNTIVSLVCGRTVPQSKAFSVSVEKATSQLLNYWDLNSNTFFLPILEPFKKILYQQLKGVHDGLDNMSKILWKEIEDHERNFDDSNLTDYMDYCIAETKKRADQSSAFSRTAMNGNSQILLAGGNDTIRTTIEWTMMYMAKYPDIQDRAYQEIVNVLGKERPPSWSDREILPYVEALILESSRCASIAPLGISHWTLADSIVSNYDIPKDTYVINNIYAVHMDPCLWDNPQEFNPDRFLIDNGNKCLTPEFLIPFGYGKRSCPGEKLGAISVFLFVASILQRFQIFPPKGGLNLDAELKTVLHPKNRYLRFDPRD